MRISESKMRRIIREEARRALQEMPYAGSLGIRHSPDEEGLSFTSTEVADGPNRQGAEKFARSGRFKTLAEKNFANIPYQVWVAPLIGVSDEVYDSVESTRVRTTPLVPGGIRTLEKLGFESPARVGGDDVVILYTTMSTERNSMATPWMLIHAMFDSGDSTSNVCSSFADFTNTLMFGDPDEVDPELAALAGDYDIDWIPALTMRSAREGLAQAPQDAYAEIMCQELLTKGGFQVNPAGAASKYVKALHALKPYIKRFADEFRQNIRGKLITVAVN